MCSTLTSPFSIFIIPPSITHLRERLKKRGTDSEKRIKVRLQRFQQEMEFKDAVRVGENLRCIASLASNNIRGDWRFMVVNLSVLRSSGDQVMEGKSTIILPAENKIE